jgi:hypothetical protein
MDILAHALWAGVGTALVSRKFRLKRRDIVLTIVLAVLPDALQLVPIIGWVTFGTGSIAALNLDPAVDRLLFFGEARGHLLCGEIFASPIGRVRYAPDCASAEPPGFVAPRCRAGPAASSRLAMQLGRRTLGRAQLPDLG